MTKIATCENAVLLFHGNCRSNRIVEALKRDDDLVRTVITDRGIYNPDAKNIKRYSEAIFHSKDNKVRVC